MKKRLVAAFLLLSLAGCCSAQVKPYQDALHRYRVAGQHIIEDIPEPKTDGARARLEAFKEACREDGAEEPK